MTRSVSSKQVIRLAEKESETFAAALLNPREPTPRLKQAARRYIEAFGDNRRDVVLN